MAKKVAESVKATEQAPEAVAAPESPYVLVEAPDGSGAYRVDVPAEVGRERVVNVGGVSYEHCADDADGRWIYRVSR